MANNLFNQLNNQQTNNFNMNPRIQQIMNLIKQSGMSPKDLFYAKAKEMGVDPNSILNQLK